MKTKETTIFFAHLEGLMMGLVAVMFPILTLTQVL